MAAKIITNARFCNRIDSLPNWREHNPILRSGELGIIMNGINQQTVGIIGNGTNTVNDILDNYPIYNNNIIFFGQGAQYQIPLAGLEVGGVYSTDKYTTGISIKNGVIQNELVSEYDDTNLCYVVDKLRINSLIYDNLSMLPTFNTNFIELRYIDPNADNTITPTPLQDGEYAGIKIINSTTATNGALISTEIAIDNTEQLYVTKQMTKYPVLTMTELMPDYYGPASSKMTIPCFISVDKETKLGTFVKPSFLTFTNPYWSITITDPNTGEEIITDGTKTYDGSTPISIDLTPPTVVFNSQVFNYDSTTNTYSIILDEGGLSPENAEKIAKIDNLESNIININNTINNINQSLENKLEAQDIVFQESETTAVQTTGTSYTISLKQVTVQNKTGQDTNASSGFTAITDIEVDEYGRLKTITKTKYVFV